jgi:transposase
MLNLEGKRVFLACGFYDMRKSINGLMSVVSESFNLDPFDGAVFVFCNKSRNRMKALVWDGDGFWLHLKRLEKGRFKWVMPGDEATMTLTGEELSNLLNGTRIELKLQRNEVFERKIS